MTMAVQRELMSALMDLSHKVWMPFNFMSDQKESRADIMLCQYIHHLRRVARMWTIVEGQCDLRACSVAVEKNSGMASLQNRADHLPDSTLLFSDLKSDCRLEGDSHFDFGE
jgi:hypothetical protein